MVAARSDSPQRPLLSRLDRRYAVAGSLIDKNSTVPLYLQLAEELQDAIQSGSLAPGGRLDSELDIATDLGVSRPTVRRAIQELVDRGLLVRRRGVGTQVVAGPAETGSRLLSLYDDLSRDRKRPGTQVLSSTTLPATADMAHRLRVQPGSPVVRLYRLRSADGVPLALLENFLPATVAELSLTALRSASLYAVLRGSGVTVKVARQKIGARVATDEESRLLGRPPAETVLTVDRLAFDDSGRPVEWGRHTYRPDRYDIAMTLTV